MASLHILVDNQGNCDMDGEHGLSILIETDIRFLFDTGQSDLFLRNAFKLGLNLESVSTVVLSHGHWDHGNGLAHTDGYRLIAHPSCFTKRYNKKDRAYCGLAFDQSAAETFLELHLSPSPVWLSPTTVFLGQIPRLHHFEISNTSFFKGRDEDDFLEDDSAIAIKTAKGIVIVTGCSHCGICNIVDYAAKITKTSTIYAIVGGLHLAEVDQKTRRTIEELKKRQVRMVFPLHCTRPAVSTIFNTTFQTPKIKTGDTLKLT